MCINTRTRNPTGEDIKDIKEPEEQYPMDSGKRNYTRVAGDSEEEIEKTENKTDKNDDANMEKLKDYIGLELAHNFLIY